MKKENETKITAEPGKQELFVSKEFNAPRELVFKAHTDPKLFARWFGCRDMTTSISLFEAKAGGSYKFIQTLKGQPPFTSHGVFHEVSQKQIIKTSEVDFYPGHILLEITRFEELPHQRTRIHVQTIFQTVEDRNAMVASGFEKGATETHERLDEILKEFV